MTRFQILDHAYWHIYEQENMFQAIFQPFWDFWGQIGFGLLLAATAGMILMNYSKTLTIPAIFFTLAAGSVFVAIPGTAGQLIGRLIIVVGIVLLFLIWRNMR